MYRMSADALNATNYILAPTVAAFALGAFVVLPVAAQSSAGDPKATEQWTPVPAVVSPGATEGAPPSDAIVLFDGRNADEWVKSKDHSPAGWTVEHGVLTVNKAAGNIETKRQFKNF